VKLNGPFRERREGFLDVICEVWRVFRVSKFRRSRLELRKLRNFKLKKSFTAFPFRAERLFDPGSQASGLG
jgi:hypothetical protein